MSNVLTFPKGRVVRTFGKSNLNTEIKIRLNKKIEHNYAFNKKSGRAYKKGEIIGILGTGYKDKRYKITRIFEHGSWLSMEGIHLGSSTGKHKCIRMIGKIEDIEFKQKESDNAE